MLRHPGYQLEGPVSFRGEWKPVQKPILQGSDFEPKFMLGVHFPIISPNPECEAALNRLKEIIEKEHRQTGVLLEKGDLLVIDNSRGLHGRSPFFCEFNGNDRWLQRIHILKHGKVWRNREAKESYGERSVDGFQR
jgi:alpha-ketoglutarate-dependent taurine dioxygenase